ncbi:MAG: glycosyltransferase [Alphaproteobacteria bacterium]|nr:glycosyltransferase [Alphaproteobacteria bacterium]
MSRKNKPELSPRKAANRDLADRLAPERDAWIDRNAFYYQDHWRYLRFLVGEGRSVLDLGCGTGRMLEALAPERGVGVDLSGEMIRIAGENNPDFTFLQGDIEDSEFMKTLKGPFDVIILSDTIGFLEDCETTLAGLQTLCTRDTRIILSYYSKAWEPVLKLAEFCGLKIPQKEQNWLTAKDLEGLLNLADFDVVKKEWRQLMPKPLLGLGRLINGTLGTLPGVRRLCLRNYLVARSMNHAAQPGLSATVLVPCRNERGNIEAAVQRLPRFCDDLEILFVEGGSEDGTWREIERVIEAYPDLNIKAAQQEGSGKSDAVRKGFAMARGEVLMILDADLTVPPEDIPKFYRALVNGKGEFINGTRLVYPMESQAMRTLNYLANHIFSLIFSWLLNQRFTDTLCGTKVLTKANYEKIAAGRSYFGEFDPFGDFDLIFGAAKQNLKVVELPIRYADRTYGETQISRFRHGLLLIRMVIFAFRKLKAI